MPSIDFRIQKQQHSDWCWAAVATSVEQYYNPRSAWCQCRVASGMAKEEKLKVTCGTCRNSSKVPETCNRVWYLDKALKIVSRLKGRPRQGFLSFEQIEKLIETGHPVCVRVLWGRGPIAHFVVISGCTRGKRGEKWVDISDPFIGSSTWLYEEFRSNYEYYQGHWSETYFTA